MEPYFSQQLYLDLLKKCLTRSIFEHRYEFVPIPSKKILAPLGGILKRLPYRVVRPAGQKKPGEGPEWPLEGETMISMNRLDHLQACIAEIIQEDIPGDLIETGVWRGGATILMRAVLKAHQDERRKVWVADSFQGLPQPNAKDFPADSKDRLHRQPVLASSLEEVRDNFRKYGLLDDQVQFLVGWFKDTLPNAPFERLAILRLDGDMYESTMEALAALYPKLSVGGYVIIDDYGALNSCKKAVEDYRTRAGINEKIKHVDDSCVFWKRLG